MKIKFLDGSMGTMLQGMGLAAGELPELLNITDSEKVLSVHRAYAAAGSEYITTNTFGANRLKIENPEEVIKAGVRLAKSTGKKVALDIGPTGKLLKPMGELDSIIVVVCESVLWDFEKNECVNPRQSFSPGYFDLDITEQK